MREHETSEYHFARSLGRVCVRVCACVSAASLRAARVWVRADVLCSCTRVGLVLSIPRLNSCGTQNVFTSNGIQVNLLLRLLRLPRLPLPRPRPRLLAHLTVAPTCFIASCATQNESIFTWKCGCALRMPANRWTRRRTTAIVFSFSSRSGMHKVHWSTLLCAHCTSPMSSTSQLHALAHSRVHVRVGEPSIATCPNSILSDATELQRQQKKRSRESINVFIFIGLTFISAICFNYIMQIYLLDLLEAFLSISPSVVVFNLIDI